MAEMKQHVVATANPPQNISQDIWDYAEISGVIVLYPVYTCTFNPERNRFRSHASVYTTPTNPDQRLDPD